MAERTSVTTDTAGRRVVAKVVGTADEAARLEREVRQLEAARHPGVVELVGIDGHGMGAILLTAHVDGPTLAGAGRLPLEEAAGLLAALATTVADLHDLGVVHGAVRPEHVIIGAGGRPVLCSLGYGGPVGELDPAVDVAALGELARFLAPDPPAGHALGRVAAGDEASARHIADLLQHEVPAARLPRGLPSPALVRPRPRSAPADPLAALRSQRRGLGGGRRPTRAVALCAAGVAAAVVVGGGAFLLAGSAPGPAPAVVTDAAEAAPTVPDPPPPDEVQPGPPTTRAGLVSSTTTTSTAPVVARRDCPATGAVLQADVDGDGCPDALRYANGILEAGDVRWELGQPGDQVATGNWGCQGTRTLALFRPSTGEVFRLDGWAAPGHDLTATAVGRVQGGQVLRAADLDRDGCHEVVVERATGPAEIIRLPR